MKSNFAAQIYEDAKKLFPDGAVQTLSRRIETASGELPKVDSAVRLIHTPTGTTITSEEFSTQYENFVAAVIRLRIACDERDT